MIKKKILLPIFSREVRFFYGTYEKMLKIYGEFPNVDGYTAGLEDEETGAFHYVVWINSESDKPIEVIAHEALHLAYFVLNDVGQEHDVENHEVLAYLLGYLVDIFYTAIMGKR